MRLRYQGARNRYPITKAFAAITEMAMPIVPIDSRFNYLPSIILPTASAM